LAYLLAVVMAARSADWRAAHWAVRKAGSTAVCSVDSTACWSAALMAARWVVPLAGWKVAQSAAKWAEM